MNANQLGDSEDSSSNSALLSKAAAVAPPAPAQPGDKLKRFDDDDEPFYFESDTLALKNNPEYSCLLKTLILLEGQRMKACEDLQKLLDLKEQALRDPLGFVGRLGEGDVDLVPEVQRQMVYVLPEINWNKYYDCVGLDDLEAIKSQNFQRTTSLRQLNKLKQQEAAGAGAEQQARKSETTTTTTTGKRQVRIKQEQQQEQEKKEKQSGRSYNKPWGVDEQRRLEELLLEFPPEDNEAARWRKIANKLGTRTMLQVQSHCQKYFIKLAKAGLPIPGRMPNLRQYTTKKGSRGNRKSSLVRGACMAAGVSTVSGMGSGRARSNKMLNVQGYNRRMVGRGVNLNEISSMWSSFNPPVIMNDDHDDHHHHHHHLQRQSSRDESGDGQASTAAATAAGTSGSLYYAEGGYYDDDDEAEEGEGEDEYYEEDEGEDEEDEYGNEEEDENYEAYEDSNDQAN